MATRTGGLAIALPTFLSLLKNNTNLAILVTKEVSTTFSFLQYCRELLEIALRLVNNVKTSNLCALLRKLQLYYIAWKVAEELHTSKYILKIKKQVPLKFSFSEQATKT